MGVGNAPVVDIEGFEERGGVTIAPAEVVVVEREGGVDDVV